MARADKQTACWPANPILQINFTSQEYDVLDDTEQA